MAPSDLPWLSPSFSKTMANPNLLNVTSIYGKTVTGALTTVSTSVLANSAASGKVFKISAIYISNVDGINASAATVLFYDSTTAVSRKICLNSSVPAGATLVPVTKESAVYLEEGDSIWGSATADSDLEYIISYEEMS
jgi:hypothetical protein